MEQTNVAPVEESKTTTTATPEATASVKTEPEKMETVSEALGINETPVAKEEVKVVPEAVFLEVKRELKALKRRLDTGEEPTKKEVSASIKSIADKYSLDDEFLGELVSAVRSESKSEFEDTLAAKLGPIQERDREEKIDKAFTGAYARAIEAAPEFKGIANSSVIKALSLDPKNSNKTFNQLLEEAYGHLIEGKRTVDAPHGGNKGDNMVLDMARAKTDPKYFAEIMDNPVLKKQYNEKLPESLSAFL